MHKEGHLGINLLLFSPLSYVLLAADQMELLGLGLVLMGAFATLPDVDMSLPIRHRGPTHTLWFAGLMGVVGAAVGVYFSFGSNLLWTIAVGFVCGVGGIVGHLLGDVITPMGLQPFEPFSDRKVTLDLVYAKNESVNEGLFTVGSGAWVASLVLSVVGIPI